MRIARLRYLQGANLCSGRSGLLVWLELDQQSPQWLAWRPDGDAAALVLAGLERLLPALQREPRMLTAQALSTAEQPALELLLAICAALLRDWTVRPGRARLLALGPKACRLFLPADDPDLGQQACRLALSCLAALPGWLAAGVPSEPAGWRQGYQDFVALAQRLAPATARIADRLLPAAGGGRVPVAGITGSLGKTTTCRMLACILGAAGHQVALATTQGIYVGSKPLRLGDLAWGGNGAVLMQDPSVTAGVFEMARGGLIKRGLGLAGVDVGAVLNVHDNHLGLDGVHSRQALAQVKRLVVRHARKMAVLNGDDPLCLEMTKGLQVPVCLVSEHPGRPELLRHLAGGGHAVLLESHQGLEHIVLRIGAAVLGRVAVAALPCSWNGAYRPAVANAMFALAVAHGMGVDFELGARALAAFESSYESNPGRMNFIAGLPFRLLLTWADGPQAYAGLARFVLNGDMPNDRTLMFCAVGNRQNEFITASARAVAGAFTRYVCTEMDEDLRGRPGGEVAALLAQGLRQAGVPEQAIVVEPSSDAACRRALAVTPAGALLVLATYRSDMAMAAVRSIWPKTD